MLRLPALAAKVKDFNVIKGQRVFLAYVLSQPLKARGFLTTDSIK